MKTVFLSGSRKIGQLNDAVRQRLCNMVHAEMLINLGDAPGADTAMQKYFGDLGYRNVTVFCVGGHCRNNIGGWQIQHIAPVPGKNGRAFYTLKDQEMARLADVGFVIWDGDSLGSITNVFELVRLGKKAVVYLDSDKTFVNISDFADAWRLVEHGGQELERDLRHKLRAFQREADHQRQMQDSFAF